MNVSLRTATMIAWLLAGALLGIKVLVMWQNGGSDEGIVAVLFLTGFLSLVIAAVLSGVMLGRPRGRWVAVAAAIALPVVVVILHSVVDGMVKGIFDPSGWFKDEMGILADAVIALVIAFVLFVRRTPTAAN